MPRSVRYSPSRGARALPDAGPAAPQRATTPTPEPVRRHRRLPSPQQLQWAAMALLALVLAAALWWLQPAPQPRITQKMIDAAVLHMLEHNSLPSATARAAEAVAPSVVRVIGYATSKKGKEVERIAEARRSMALSQADLEGARKMAEEDASLAREIHVDRLPFVLTCPPHQPCAVE